MEITIEDEKSVNSSIKSNKKICFTPTQASETSEHYYDIDEKTIPSFDTVVHKTESMNDDLRCSSPIKNQNAIEGKRKNSIIGRKIK